MKTLVWIVILLILISSVVSSLVQLIEKSNNKISNKATLMLIFNFKYFTFFINENISSI